MIDCSIQPNPVFIILFVFKDQDDTCLFAGLEGIVQTLPDSLCPFLSEIKLNSVGISQTVAPCTIRQHNLCLSAMLSAPLFLIPFLRMLSICEAGRGTKKNYQDGDSKFFHVLNISEIMGNSIKKKRLTC